MRRWRNPERGAGGRSEALREAGLLIAAHLGTLLYLLLTCLPRPVF